MTNTEIQLSSGKKVILEDFNLKLTYQGMLVGKIDTLLNYKIIKDIIESYEGYKVVLTLEGAYQSKERLKRYICSARLSSEPKEKEFDGSYLNVVWFRNDISNITIEQMIQGLNIDWEGDAEGYKF